MTAQIPDRLIHRGRVLDLCATPLAHYLDRLPKARRPTFRASSSANWRGYVATWEIVERRLFLTAIEGWVVNEIGKVKDASLTSCIPWRRHPIPATWVTGDLRCPEGRLRNYVHAAFASSYERDRIFWVERGIVLEEWLVFNPPAPLYYRIEPDRSRTYFDGPSSRTEHLAPDPFPADAAVEPWRLWGRPDWGFEPGDDEGGDGWVIGGLTQFDVNRDT